VLHSGFHELPIQIYLPTLLLGKIALKSGESNRHGKPGLLESSVGH
jgi:hypothetical protein